MSTPVVLDTNVLFSALLRADSPFTEVVLTRRERFVIGELVLAELFRHKERIVKASRLDEPGVSELYYRLLRHVEVAPEALIRSEHRATARAWCADVDPHDEPVVALPWNSAPGSGRATGGSRPACVGTASTGSTRPVNGRLFQAAPS